MKMIEENVKELDGLFEYWKFRLVSKVVESIADFHTIFIKVNLIETFLVFIFEFNDALDWNFRQGILG